MQKTGEFSNDKAPEATQAMLAALGKAGVAVNATITYIDDKTGNVVSGQWNSLDESTRNYIVGGAKVLSIAMPVGAMAEMGIVKATGAAGAAESAVATKSVFWSGSPAAQAAAEKYALSTGGTTLEMTQAGQNLTNITKGMAWDTEARPLWVNASNDFAQSASGQVSVFHSSQGVTLNSIWGGVEYPTLINNPGVTGINYHVVTPQGVITKIK